MAKNRRDKGDGHVSRKKGKDGLYKGYITIGYKPNGEPDRRYRKAKTQAEVRRKLREIKHRTELYGSADTKTPLSEYLERYLQIKEGEVKAKTMDTYRYNVERYILPRLGNVQLGKIDPLQVQMALHDISKKHGARTSNYCRSILSGALNRAVDWQLLARNPIEGVKRVKETKCEMILWTPEQTRKFLDVASEHRLYALFHLALLSGLRIGELLGLQWQDLNGDVLHVRRTLTTVKGKPFLSTPKTERGKRAVTLPQDALKVLEQHRAQQDAEREYLGDSWTETEHIFLSTLGTLLGQRGVTRLSHSLQEKAGVPRARLHDARHMHVSLLVKSKVDPSAVADRLGHADPAFTLRQYSHVFEEQRRGALTRHALRGQSRR